MSHRFTLFNYEMGFFIKKSSKLVNLSKTPKFSNKNHVYETKNESWEYNAPMEKRLKVLTGYDYLQDMVVEKGYLHWLFRDVDMQCLDKPESFDLPMILALQGTKKWGDILLNAGATEEQIDLYYKVSGILFIRVIDRIYNKNLNLFRNISNAYSSNETFRKLISYSGDDIDGL